MMDMGCHGIAWFRWMLGGRPKAVSVQAHDDRHAQRAHSGRG